MKLANGMNIKAKVPDSFGDNAYLFWADVNQITWGVEGFGLYPPVFLVRADNFSDAEEWFAEFALDNAELVETDIHLDFDKLDPEDKADLHAGRSTGIGMANDGSGRLYDSQCIGGMDWHA